MSIAGIYLTGYPLNIGGRPLVSLPSFIVPAFEITILFAALTAVLGHDRAVRAADALSPGVQREASSASAGRSTVSSSASKPPIRSSTPRARAQLLAGLGASEVHDVAE